MVNDERRDVVEKLFLTKNGIKIYSYKNPALHSFHLSLFLRAGAMFEAPEENGITHFLEHVSIRNVNSIMSGALYSELDRYGLEFNASSFSEMVQFYMSGASKNLKCAVPIFAKLLSPIALGKDEIDAERKRIKAEIRESDEKNSLLSFTNEITHKGTSLAKSIVGSNPVIDKITRKKLEEYRKRNFTANNLFVYLTGNFEDSDIESLAEELEKYELSAGIERENFAPVPEDFGKRALDVHIKNADFTMARFTFDLDLSKVGVPETDLIYDILLSGYASRFFIEMSEKRGLFYDINGALERYRNIGELYFYYEIKEQYLYEALEITVDILNSLKRELLSEAELMKAPYVDNAYNLFDDNREFNFTFAYDRHIMKLPYASLDERIKAYECVTPEVIFAAACEIFRPENLTLTLKGKKKKIDIEKIKTIIKKLNRDNYESKDC